MTRFKIKNFVIHCAPVPGPSEAVLGTMNQTEYSFCHWTKLVEELPKNDLAKILVFWFCGFGKLVWRKVDRCMADENYTNKQTYSYVRQTMDESVFTTIILPEVNINWLNTKVPEHKAGHIESHA